ncbi:DUF2894 domain-containing protein [Pseudoxanthomonas dokdonensis]|nr:DUF2894 domain-containing protein [Pseudoxanthomonas dokdonensis]
MDGKPRDNAMELRNTLQGWCVQGAGRMDPVRFGLIQALAGRIDQHRGRARQLLLQRLSGLIDTYAADLKAWPRSDATTSAAITALPSPLRELLDELAVAGSGSSTMADGQAASPAIAGEDLPALQQARQQWTRLRTDSQLRASLQPLPSNAGPLNSAVLVHRALSLMRDVSPAYLQHFILYADTLSSLQRLRDEYPALASGAPAASGKMTARPARKRSRKRTG